MESYSKPALSGIAPIIVSEEGEENTTAVAAAMVQRPSDLKLILERVETQLKEVEEGLLKQKYDSVSGQTSWTQLVVPRMLREEIMQELHAGSLEGHLGEDKTLGKIKERFYWPGVQQDVAQRIRTCPVCATRKSSPRRNRALLRTVASGFPM